jgi:S1-C subfamily serine protease
MSDMDDDRTPPVGAMPPLPPPPGTVPLSPAAVPSPVGVHAEAPGGPRRGRAVVAAVIAGLLLIATGTGIGIGISRSERSQGSRTSGGSPPVSGGATSGSNVRAIADRVSPAIVDINTYQRTSYAGTSSSQRPLGAGTGMILTSSGEVLTNNHVVRGATSIRVAVSGRGTYPATVVGVDPTDDVALVQIQGVSGLPVVTTGDASSLRVGQELVAIGNALGQGGTSTTVGTVTGLDKTITANDEQGSSERLHGMIQTDASISPGDSGGAVVNADGQVVGMITAGARNGPFPTTSRVGFAITTDSALKVIDAIRSGQSSSSILIGPRGFLGVEITTAPAGTASGAPAGALVAAALPGTPAARAGIGQNDIITSIDDSTISSPGTLGTVLHQHRPGDVVRVTWVDSSGSHSSSVSLIVGPAV